MAVSLTKNVRLNIQTSGSREAHRDINELAKSGEKLSKSRWSPEVNLKVGAAEHEIRRVDDMLGRLAKKKAVAEAEVKGDKARATVLDIERKLTKLNGQLSKPGITLEGVKHVEADILRTSASMDRLGRKTAHMKVDVRTDHKGGLLGTLLGGIGGMAKALARAAKIGGSVVSSVASGIQSAGPYVIGAAIAAAITIGLLITPAILATGIGLGVGILGAIAVGLHKNSKGKLVGPIADLMHTVMNTIKKAAEPIKKVLPSILGGLGRFVKREAGPLREMFKASIPFIRMFARLMEQTAKAVIPAFTQVMKEMRPQLPQMRQALMALVRGFIMFIHIIGPAIKPSVQIFKVLCKIMEGVMVALGAIIVGAIHQVMMAWQIMRAAWKFSVSVVKVGARDLSGAVMAAFRFITRTVPKWWDDMTSFVTRNFRAAWHAVSGFAKNLWHDVSHFFGNLGSDAHHIWNDFTHFISGRFQDAKNFISGLAQRFWHDLVNWFGNIKSGVSNIWDHMWDWVRHRISDGRNAVVGVAKGLWTDLKHWFGNIEHDVSSIWTRLWNGLKRIAHTMVTAVGSVINGIRNAFSTPIHWVEQHVWNPMASIWNKAVGFVGLNSLKVPKFAEGGIVGGGGTMDNVPILAKSGERILSVSQVHMMGGHTAIDNMVGRSTQGDGVHFAKGGKPGNSGGANGFGPGEQSPLQGVREPGTGIFSGLINLGKKIVGWGLGEIEKHLFSPVLGTLVSKMPGASGIKKYTHNLTERLAEGLSQKLKSAAESMGGSGGKIVDYARKFRNLPYVFGGNDNPGTKGTDCSGFVHMIYQHFGLAKGMPRTSEAQYGWSHHVPTPVVGGLIFMKGADGTNAKGGAGHVGIVSGRNKYISEYSTAIGWREGPFDPGAHSFGLPHGWTKNRFMGKFDSVGQVGPGYVNIGKGLMRVGFDKAAAAGITGAIAGESAGKPESIEGNVNHHGAVKDAGRPGHPNGGLIGWTGTWRGPGQMITGNEARDMGAQIQGIKRYVQANGSMHDMNRFTSPITAGEHWSIAYERPAVRLSDWRPSVARAVYTHLWGGGMINEPSIAVGLRSGNLMSLAEFGPERVIPAGRSATMAAGGGGGVTVINIMVQGDTDPDGAARRIHQKLRKYKTHNGNKPLGLG